MDQMYNTARTALSASGIAVGAATGQMPIVPCSFNSAPHRFRPCARAPVMSHTGLPRSPLHNTPFIAQLLHRPLHQGLCECCLQRLHATDPGLHLGHRRANLFAHRPLPQGNSVNLLRLQGCTRRLPRRPDVLPKLRSSTPDQGCQGSVVNRPSVPCSRWETTVGVVAVLGTGLVNALLRGLSTATHWKTPI